MLLPKTPTIELKRFDESNFFDGKQNLNSSSGDILKICHIRMDSAK